MGVGLWPDGTPPPPPFVPVRGFDKMTWLPYAPAFHPHIGQPKHCLLYSHFAHTWVTEPHESIADGATSDFDPFFSGPPRMKGLCSYSAHVGAPRRQFSFSHFWPGPLFSGPLRTQTIRRTTAQCQAPEEVGVCSPLSFLLPSRGPPRTQGLGRNSAPVWAPEKAPVMEPRLIFTPFPGAPNITVVNDQYCPLPPPPPRRQGYCSHL